MPFCPPTTAKLPRDIEHSAASLSTNAGRQRKFNDVTRLANETEVNSPQFGAAFHALL